jgi:hypothetical protein
MMESDNFATDPVARSSPGKPALAGRSTLLSFGSEFGLLTVVDLDRGKVAHTAKASTGDGSLFDGFTSMALTADGAAVHGVTPHVTEGGFCSDGCFRFGVQQIAGFHGGRFAGLGAAGLPFKAALADARYFDAVGDVYYTQGSYPLAPAAACAADGTAQCMYAVNASTGLLLGAAHMPHYTPYAFADAPLRYAHTPLPCLSRRLPQPLTTPTPHLLPATVPPAPPPQRQRHGALLRLRRALRPRPQLVRVRDARARHRRAGLRARRVHRQRHAA